MVKKLSRISSDSPRFCLTHHFGKKWKERTKTTGQAIMHDADDLTEEGAEREIQTEMRPMLALASLAVLFWDCQMMCSMSFFSTSAPKLFVNCARFANVSDSLHRKTACGCHMKRSTRSCVHLTAGEVDFVVLSAMKLDRQFTKLEFANRTNASVKSREFLSFRFFSQRAKVLVGNQTAGCHCVSSLSDPTC